MKRIITLAVTLSLVLLYNSGHTQSQVKASLGIGVAPNRVKVYMKSPAVMTNKVVGNFQFDIAVPNTVAPKPTVTMKTSNNALAPAGWTLDQITPGFEESGYFHYIFVANNLGFYSASLPANSEVEVCEIEFTNGPNLPSDVYLMTLGDKLGANIGGGLTGNALYAFNAGANEFVSNLEAQGFFYTRSDNDGIHFTTVLNNLSLTTTDSSFAKLNGGVLLPVNFLGFEVINNGNLANLKWSVEGEDANTKLYEVQSSSDGVNFKTFATVAAKGNGSNTYSLNDVALNAGVNYYRIKQLDKDGKFALSPVRSLTLGGKSGGVSVFPNPASTSVKTTVSLSKKGAYTVIISNAAGQVVSTQKYGGNKGDNIESINLSNLADGTYNFKFITDEGTKVVPVVKSK